MKFEIESHIPLPESDGCFNQKYPFDKMKIGDSFLAPSIKNVSDKKLLVRVISKSCYYKSRYNNATKFKSKIVKGGIRTWRIK